MRKVFSFFILISGLLLATSCASWNAKNKREAALHAQIGTSALESGQYPQALAELLAAEQLDSKSPSIQNNLGLAYYFRERADLAEIHIRKALELDPNYTDARNNLSRVLTERGQYKAAFDEARRASEDLTYLSPDKPQVNMGIALFKMQNYDDARSHFLKAIQYSHDSCVANSYYGRTLYEMKELSRAAEQLDRAVSFCQKDLFDEPLYYSALTYFQMGNKEKSEARFRELLKLYPNGLYRDKSKEMLDTIKR